MLVVADAVGLTHHPGGTTTTDLLVERCGLFAGDRVLDAGCGTGRTAVHLARRHGLSVVAVDREASLLQHARRLVGAHDLGEQVELREADATALPFEGGTFDGVLGELVLDLADDPAPLLAELVRVTRAGGSVGLLTTVTTQGRHEDLPAEVRTFLGDVLGGVQLRSEGEVVAAVRGAGLQDVVVRPWELRAGREMVEAVRAIGLRGLAAVYGRGVRRAVGGDEVGETLRRRMRSPRGLLDHLTALLVVGRVPAAS